MVLLCLFSRTLFANGSLLCALNKWGFAWSSVNTHYYFKFVKSHRSLANEVQVWKCQKFLIVRWNYSGTGPVKEMTTGRDCLCLYVKIHQIIRFLLPDNNNSIRAYQVVLNAKPDNSNYSWSKTIGGPHCIITGFLLAFPSKHINRWFVRFRIWGSFQRSRKSSMGFFDISYLTYK